MRDHVDHDPIRTVADLHLTVGEPMVQMAEGMFGLRLPLPFVLNHVNLWLLRDGDGWTLIDTCIDNEPTRSFWSETLESGLDGRPLRRIIATHFHPDHMGLAGWLCEQTGAALWTTRTEWLLGRGLANDVSAAFVDAGRLYDQRAGLDAEHVLARAERGNLYRTRAGTPAGTYTRVTDGDDLVIDGELWRVIIGPGHAPEMICLYSAERGILISADHVLQKISPNISVTPSEPDADPLNDYMTSFDPFRALPEDTLVLPSHGQPFHGLHARIDELIAHHHVRLERTAEAAGKGRTAVDIMPALFERELDAHQLGFALGEALAHLNYLVFKGDLKRELDSAGAYRYSAA
ncbi:MAG: MBL fold metallo-hydrolase [Alphaproteobacteria bacterium]